MNEMVGQITRSRIAETVDARLKRRHALERRFRFYGQASIIMAIAFLGILLFAIVAKGSSAFVEAEVRLPIAFRADRIDPEGLKNRAALASADYGALVREAFQQRFGILEPDRATRRQMSALLSQGDESVLRDMVLANPATVGTTQPVWLPVSAAVDQLLKGHTERRRDRGGQFSDQQLGWIDTLRTDGSLAMRPNLWLFTRGDSRQPELAGLWGATVGSFFLLLVTLILSFPLGVATAIYLEEFAPKNKWTDLIEVNINNLAAVPSIVFGLLALEMFLNVLGLPRSAPFVGGLTLTLVSLPTIIIAGRAALKAVPPWIREAALGLGASRLQMVMHHVLPLAMPGILTGAIIGMARALGESAPLLMIGMVAFIVDVPATPMDPATALPVQVYLWSASPERAFVERTSAAIIVLLAFLVVMNATAVCLRKKFERRW